MRVRPGAPPPLRRAHADIHADALCTLAGGRSASRLTGARVRLASSAVPRWRGAGALGGEGIQEALELVGVRLLRGRLARPSRRGPANHGTKKRAAGQSQVMHGRYDWRRRSSFTTDKKIQVVQDADINSWGVNIWESNHTGHKIPNPQPTI